MLVLPSLHPAFLLRSSDSDARSESRFYGTVVNDFRRALQLTRRVPDWDESCIHVRDRSGRPTALYPTIENLEHFAKNVNGILTIDDETTGEHPLDCSLICVGLCSGEYGREQVICCPFISQGGRIYWPEKSQEKYARDILKYLFSKYPTNYQNGGFDTIVNHKEGFPAFAWEDDTMLAHHVLDGELPHGLDFLSSSELEVPYWKGDVKGDLSWLELPDSILRLYNLRDVLSTHRLRYKFLPRLRSLGVEELYRKEIAEAKIMAAATIKGIEVDPERRSGTSICLHSDIDKKDRCKVCGEYKPTRPLPIGLGPRMEIYRSEALKNLCSLAGNQDFKPGSRPQLLDLFFKRLGFPILVKTDKGAPALNKESMVLMALYADNAEKKAALKNLVAWRRADKVLGTYVYGLPIGRDGRLHVNWKLLTVSGRFSSSPNAQNWNLMIKRMFRAGDGFIFCGIDLSQAELRAIAYLANDPILLDAYERGLNVHTVNAALLFEVRSPGQDTNDATEAYLNETVPRTLKVKYSDLPVAPAHRWKEIRKLAKNFVFGCVDSETPVATLHGSTPIKDLKPGEWTWVWDGKKYAKARIKHVWKSGIKECFRLTVIDGAYKRHSMVLTSDHELVLRDGSKRHLSDIAVGTSLMPFRRYVTKLGYVEIDPYNDRSRWYEHRWVMGDKSDVVHHENGDRSDNRPENLKALDHTAHRHIHPKPKLTTEESKSVSERVSAWWSKNHDTLVKRLTRARLKSKKWQAGVRRGAAKRVKHYGPCPCGKPGKVKGLCKNCYVKKWRHEHPNHIVVSIDPVGPREVWDLEVDHPAHNFPVTDAGIFVGNSNYGAEPETLFTVLFSKIDSDTGEQMFPDLDQDTIVALKAAWESMHPAIPIWWNSITNSIMRAGRYVSPYSGRIHWFRSGFKRNDMLNRPIQELVASHMIRMIDIHERMRVESPGSWIISQIHDALTAECAIGEEKIVGKIMTEELSRPFSLPGFKNAVLPPDEPTYGRYFDQV